MRRECVSRSHESQADVARDGKRHEVIRDLTKLIFQAEDNLRAVNIGADARSHAMQAPA